MLVQLKASAQSTFCHRNAIFKHQFIFIKYMLDLLYAFFLQREIFGSPKDRKRFSWHTNAFSPIVFVQFIHSHLHGPKHAHTRWCEYKLAPICIQTMPRASRPTQRDNSHCENPNSAMQNILRWRGKTKREKKCVYLITHDDMFDNCCIRI